MIERIIALARVLELFVHQPTARMVSFVPTGRQAATGVRPRSNAKSRYPACAAAAQYSRYLGNPPVKRVSPRGLSLTLAPRYQVFALLSSERWASLATSSIQPSSAVLVGSTAARP